MKEALIQGILTTAQYCPSPNYDERPPNSTINLLVIHNISLPPRQFGGPYIQALFQNSLDHNEHPFFQTLIDLRVSSHLLIRRGGEVVQFVPFNKRAWHAGKSKFQGQENCNDFSIGIELEGADDIPYTTHQYQQLAAITRTLQKAYPHITRDRIVGHSDVAPQRKTDPGPAFDWKGFLRMIS